MLSRLWLWIRGLFVGDQCRALLAYKARKSGNPTYLCCIKRRGHFGPHKTYSGKEF